ncbi:MAG: putative toxin-antitoxin system toxin component, PIN family [Candidatus Thermoplasmatota archaeon]|nr:putative toxin-antitoxin system toxin component, PIN family [Candidatus Thermoplasmatota archaeon]
MDGMRLFLDANILVSGIVFKGNEHDLLLKSNKVNFITSEDAIDETMRTIEKKLPEYTTLVVAFLNIIDLTIVKRKEYIKELHKYDLVRDKNDRHILAAATVSKSDYIVTGDKDLIVLKKYKNIDILKTQKMLSLI